MMISKKKKRNKTKTKTKKKKKNDYQSALFSIKRLLRDEFSTKI
jgi:hypothetical protein